MQLTTLHSQGSRDGGRPRRARGVALVAALALAGLAGPLAAASPAFASDGGATAPTTPTDEAVCGTPTPGHMSCFSRRRTDAHVAHGKGVRRSANGQLDAAAVSGYGPADLLSAYNLPADGGEGATIAIVDAYDNPTAEADLAVYRQQFGLPACTTDNGCFSKVDQRGGSDYPEYDSGWAGEIALDLDMVSAIAPRAHILLVEADSNSDGDLGSSENLAVTLGAGYVSNSWGGYTDDPANVAEDSAYYDHPGTAIVFSTGDDGYGVSYPASSPDVTAVGGTSLVKDSSARGWTESVWNSGNPSTGAWGAPGSGCSQVEPKPAWQHDPDCAGRSAADVSAVADPYTGVAVYDTNGNDGGWNVFGGTSASAPIIAATYALAGAVVPDSYPSSYPYETPSALNDVTVGSDASCDPGFACGFPTTPQCTPRYECQAQPGYDGPTGLGTPQGLAAFRTGPHGSVRGTVTDAAGGAVVAGAAVALGDYTTTSAADGTFALDVPPGGYDLKVSAFGFATKDLGTVTVSDGGTATEAVALTRVPSTTVTGTVTDGGGHGWGLYARLTVDGVPGTAYTDPATGAYSLTLPKGATYSLRATALYPGYQPAGADITLPADPGHGNAGAKATVATIPLKLDTTGAMAPGYHIGYGPGGGAQSFDAPAIPDGWTVDTATGAAGWNFTDTLNRGNRTGGSGHFAQIDDYALGWGPVDSSLVSPVYDLSAQTAPVLDFSSAIATGLDDQTESVDVTTDGGSTWNTVWSAGTTPVSDDHHEISLAAYAGKPSVQVRFHFTGSLAGYWEIDDVSVGARTLVTDAGGLLVGKVTDANTGAGVIGAAVSSAGTATVTAQTVAASGDPALTGGLYWLFAPGSGHQRLTAGLPDFGYPAVAGAATVKADRITTADFTVHPGKLALSAASASARVPWGTTTTVQVTVKNTGGAPATFSLGEQAGRSSAGAGSAAPAVTKVPSTATPLTLASSPSATAAATAPAGAAPSATQDGAAWQQLANAPASAEGGVAGTIDGLLYAGLGEAPGGQWSNAFSSYDPATATWTPRAHPVTTRLYPAYGVVRGKLYVAGGRDAAGSPIAGGEVYDPKTDTWAAIAPMPKPYLASGSAVVGDKLYVVGGCEATACGTTDVQVYDPASNTWSAGPSYLEPVSYPVCGTIDAKVYCSGGAYEPAEGSTTDTGDTFVLDPATGTWTQRASAPVDVWSASGTAANGQLLVAGGMSWSTRTLTDAAWSYDPATDAWSALPSLPLPLMSAASAPGWDLVGGANQYYVPQWSMFQLSGYDQPHADVSWLGEAASSLTVAPGKSVTVTLTLDASAMGPADAGTHRAALLLDDDTPYGELALPVSMEVVQP